MYTYRYVIKATKGKFVVIEEFWSHVYSKWCVCDILDRVEWPEGLPLEKADQVLNPIGWKVADGRQWVYQDFGDYVVPADVY